MGELLGGWGEGGVMRGNKTKAMLAASVTHPTNWLRHGKLIYISSDLF